MRTAQYFFGTCLLVFGLSIFYTVHAVVSRVDDIKLLVDRVPAVTAQIKVAAGELEALNAKAAASLAALKASLPGAGTSVGRAGANALRSFTERMGSTATPDDAETQ